MIIQGRVFRVYRFGVQVHTAHSSAHHGNAYCRHVVDLLSISPNHRASPASPFPESLVSTTYLPLDRRYRAPAKEIHNCRKLHVNLDLLA